MTQVWSLRVDGSICWPRLPRIRVVVAQDVFRESCAVKFLRLKTAAKPTISLWTDSTIRGRYHPYPCALNQITTFFSSTTTRG